MKKSRFSEEQIIAVLKEHQAGVAVADLCRKHGISGSTETGSGLPGALRHGYGITRQRRDDPGD
jgi:lambda repressor-like predicted transcriptional regulator